MNIEIVVNDYLLAWYILYGASLSKEIDNFKRTLFNKYKKEYNFCYKDKNEIVKYGKDFIPDNDILYNVVIESNLFKYLKKETNRHKLHIEKLWADNKDLINKSIKNIIRVKFKENITLYIIHPRLEIIEYLSDYNGLIWGSEKDRYDAITIMLLKITNGLFTDVSNNEIVSSILELAIVNEIGKNITSKHAYELGNPMLKVIKRQIYPFWIMYLGYVEKESILNKMIDDKVGFDIDKYLIDKNIQKLNIVEFVDFCIKNNRHILKLSNIMKIEKDEEVEVI